MRDLALARFGPAALSVVSWMMGRPHPGSVRREHARPPTSLVRSGTRRASPWEAGGPGRVSARRFRGRPSRLSARSWGPSSRSRGPFTTLLVPSIAQALTSTLRPWSTSRPSAAAAPAWPACGLACGSGERGPRMRARGAERRGVPRVALDGRAPRDRRRDLQRYFSPVPVLKTTTTSAGRITLAKLTAPAHAAPPWRCRCPCGSSWPPWFPRDPCFADRDGRSAGGAKRTQTQEAAERRRNAQPVCTRGRVHPGRGDVRPFAESLHDQHTPGLHGTTRRGHARARSSRVSAPSAASFHSDEPRASTRGIDDDVGKRASELLVQLVRHRLLPLDPMRLTQGRNVERVLGPVLAQPPAGVRDRLRPIRLHWFPEPAWTNARGVSRGIATTTGRRAAAP